ncbi:MAG TPA: ATP-binding protein [Burkholderiales bacterium]|nr:ATP-binding protein [Burkholderiales bacterium]
MDSTLFILWTMVGTASLTLALVHGAVWLLDRRSLAHLAFCILAFSVAAIARIEYAMMRAATPEEYAQWLRWIHVALFFATLGLVMFVRVYFGTGRAWLGSSVIGLRAVVTVSNVLGPAGASWLVTGLEQLHLLGEPVSASGLGSARPLQWLATTTAILLAVYVLDASIALWRESEREARRKAVLVGGGIVGFVLAATIQPQLVIWGLVKMPIMLSPAFLVMLGVMTYELSRDIVRAATIQKEAHRLRDELAHIARVSTLSELSGSLAHELNQPLGAILRNAEAAELLLERPAPDLAELRAIVADIRADDQRAGAIIDRMRALLKRNSLELHQVPLQPLAQEVLALVRADAAARRVTLDCAVPESLPPVVADRVQLSQVLLNLIVNGIDAVSESSKRRVAIEARRADERTVEIAVADSGHGIAPDMLAKVFEPFVTTKAKGMGIGLAVSRTIIEAHGGRLWAQNNAQAGATFRFTLPVAAASA